MVPSAITRPRSVRPDRAGQNFGVNPERLPKVARGRLPSSVMTLDTEQALRCELRIRLLDERADAPQYQSELAAGLDIAASLPDAPDGIELRPVSRGGPPVLMPTGFA